MMALVWFVVAWAVVMTTVKLFKDWFGKGKKPS